MTGSRLGTLAAAALLFAAAAAAAVLVNLLLLGSASSRNDPVGKLRPSASLPAAPPTVLRPQTGPTHGSEQDD